MDIVAHVLAQAPRPSGPGRSRARQRRWVAARRIGEERPRYIPSTGPSRKTPRSIPRAGPPCTADLFLVAPGRLGRALDHDVPANEVEIVAQAVGEPRAGRVQQKPRRFDRVPGHGHGRRFLAIFGSLVEIGDARSPPVGPDLDAAHHGAGPYFCSVGESVGHMGDERGRLGVDLAALQAEATVDAVRPVAEPAVHNGNGTTRATIRAFHNPGGTPARCPL